MTKPMRSDHFDGKKYFNPGIPPRTLWDVMRWLWKLRPARWPPIHIEQQKVQQERTAEGEASVTFINHSTVLLQIEGWNILTDPIWSERASPFKTIGPRRVGLPGVKFEDLPPIDIVLLSHNHYDHMDLPTLKRLQEKHQPSFFVSNGNRKYLLSRGIKNIEELDWWDTADFSLHYKLHFVPAQHFSARGLFDRDKTLWGGFVIKGKGHMIYFAGDTGYGPHFKTIKDRLGEPTLSFLPIGVYEPRWFMKTVHESPEDAVNAHLELGSKQSIGIHFGTFQLSEESIDAPLQRLTAALQAKRVPQETFWVLKPGESKFFLTL